jgi:uncharacterized protein YegL
MTRQNFTSINVLLDKSGSMLPLSNETIHGFNSFLQQQKNIAGDAIFSLCLFNESSHLVYDCLPLSQILNINNNIYKPNGSTALLDAIGSTIDNVGERLHNMPAQERPSKVLFLIITDGHENASTKYDLNKIKNMIEHQRDMYSWDFIFMGANIDTFSVSNSLGIPKSFDYQATSCGTKNLFNTISESVTEYRSNNCVLNTDCMKNVDCKSNQKTYYNVRDKAGRFIKKIK